MVKLVLLYLQILLHWNITKDKAYSIFFSSLYVESLFFGKVSEENLQSFWVDELIHGALK